MGYAARTYIDERCSATAHVGPHEAKEALLTKVTKGLGTCQVHSGTGYPCRRLAVVKIQDIPFCQRCAHEQEAYFAIGELTEEAPRLPHEKSLVGMLNRMRRIRRQRRVVSDRELLSRSA